MQPDFFSSVKVQESYRLSNWILISGDRVSLLAALFAVSKRLEIQWFAENTSFPIRCIRDLSQQDEREREREKEREKREKRRTR